MKSACHFFVNFSNHTSTKWTEKQKKAAIDIVGGEDFEAILDVPFPNVDPEANPADILTLAEECVSNIYTLNPAGVMVAGEPNLAFAVVALLKKHNIRCFAATTKRVTTETVINGNITKTSIFDFVQFREFLRV